MEHVCRRFRRAALSLPCHLRLTDHLSLENGRKGVLRCLRGRVPADLQLQWSWLYEDPRSGELLGYRWLKCCRQSPGGCCPLLPRPAEALAGLGICRMPLLQAVVSAPDVLFLLPLRTLASPMQAAH